MITNFKLFENHSYYFTEKEEEILTQNGFKIIKDEATKEENNLRITILKIRLATVATYFQYQVSKIDGFSAKTYGSGSDAKLENVLNDIRKIVDKQKIIYRGKPKRPLDWDYSKKNAWDTYFKYDK